MAQGAAANRLGPRYITMSCVHVYMACRRTHAEAARAVRGRFQKKCASNLNLPVVAQKAVSWPAQPLGQAGMCMSMRARWVTQQLTGRGCCSVAFHLRLLIPCITGCDPPRTSRFCPGFQQLPPGRAGCLCSRVTSSEVFHSYSTLLQLTHMPHEHHRTACPTNENCAAPLAMLYTQTHPAPSSTSHWHPRCLSLPLKQDCILRR